MPPVPGSMYADTPTLISTTYSVQFLSLSSLIITMPRVINFSLPVFGPSNKMRNSLEGTWLLCEARLECLKVVLINVGIETMSYTPVVLIGPWFPHRLL